MNINEIIDQMESGLEVALPGPWVFHPDTMRAIIAHIRELEARAKRAEVRAETAEAKVARLTEALEPFAHNSPAWDEFVDDEPIVEDAPILPLEATDLRVSDLRKAIRTLVAIAEMENEDE